MRTKNMLSVLAIAVAALFTSCGSEIPQGSSDYFNNLPSQDEIMVKKSYLPLQHPCMLHSQEDINGVKGKLAVSPWKEAYEHLQQSSYAQSSYREGTAALLDGYLKVSDRDSSCRSTCDYYL
jgi:hypothetical protein